MDRPRLLSDFLQVAALSGVKLDHADLRTEFLPAPHRRPSSLPSGTQAVYAFLCGEGCLKVGKAGPKTQARFTSQHYGENAPSTLAKSIIGDRVRMRHLLPLEAHAEFSRLDITSVGSWLEHNTARLHLFLPASADACTLALAEAFLQCRLRPLYEGTNAKLANLRLQPTALGDIVKRRG